MTVCRRLVHDPSVFLTAEQWQRLLDDLNAQIRVGLTGIDRLNYTTSCMLELLAADARAESHFLLFCPDYVGSKLEWMLKELRALPAKVAR